MKKTKDYMFLILFGLLMYISGAVILGGIKYFIAKYIGFDFVSVLLYYVISVFLAKRMMNSISIRGNFTTIYLCILTGLMYILKDFTSAFIIVLLQGYSLVDILRAIPYIMYNDFMVLINFGSISIDGIFNTIINLLYLVIEIFIMVVGIVQCYRITRRE